MKKTDHCEHRLLLAAAAILLYPSAVWADGSSADQPDADDFGFTVLSNATNVTHWGLGVGAGIEQEPYKGDGAKFLPIPLVYFDDKWLHVSGTTLDLKIGKWSNVTFTLRGKYAFDDGYKQSDAPILNGMDKRSGAFWFGPAFEWRTGLGNLSGNFLTGGNKGQRAGIDFGQPFDYGNFTVDPHVGAEWLSRKYVDYYYGVRPSEVRAGRAAYAGKSTYKMSFGVRVDYRLAPRQTLIFDVGVARLGSGITNSPLVGKKIIPQAIFGYQYQFN
ncbi:MipA/OmpV family protein [Caballeronia mineralivorans]|uniref:MipA/OmpV family protein n=1 Tax=Caballeronia mineralivorans TaxID=2010198 RepID=UPI002AFE7E58|nr:MipA/OmpV family protein [Caballeronia mineralivorans]MEA3098851.1 MipA family protein [Caballeronia mineralivorans]